MDWLFRSRLALRNMWMREDIISRIRELAAANAGVAPGAKSFENETGIGRSAWLGKFWARWSDAVSEAGLVPLERTKAIPKNEIFEKLVPIVKHYGREPTRSEFDLYRKTDDGLPWYSTLIDTFGSKSTMFDQFRAWLEVRPKFQEVALLLTTNNNASANNSLSARDSKDGYVYLLRSGGHFKIGRGENLEKRVKQIKVALPDATALIHAIRTDDPSGIEAYWHRRFAEKRGNGEWFKLTTADVAAFKKRKFQ